MTDHDAAARAEAAQRGIARWQAHRLAVLHGPDEERSAALSALQPTDGEELMHLILAVATEAAVALHEYRVALPAPMRMAPFAIDPRAGYSPMQLTSAQIVTAAANRDHDMLMALVLPWVNGTHHAERVEDLLEHLLVMAIHHHSHVCGDGR
ncbi:hypothetical protein N8K70_03755 [Microbacterium betulae]|uniref:Uncharacterized protein n=1 Tax=Microbacterium betulae TaxID=2981139 RepID=A0AA97I7T6_9MICO|nr:hypothetical protein [Microbacterium sp. AB]WOF23805.1 hypothetical protein N8K70_03755 [Microbacterium sp. AB]